MNQLQPIKKGALFLGFVLIFIASKTGAAVMDAPHSIYDCSKCHSYSLWWNYSPVEQSGIQYDVNNTICFQCHSPGNTLFPIALSHSSAHIALVGETPSHNFEERCTACHDPHRQEQLNWAGEDDPYLVMGVIDSATPDFGTNSTLLEYSSLSYPTWDSGNWPAAGDDNATDWLNKNYNNPEINSISGRSLIFVHDTSVQANTFTLLDATPNSVTINGILNPADITSACFYDDCGGSHTFGLIYGQLIRDKIDTAEHGTRRVKFFDPNGFFVDDNTSSADFPTGICQVCHTEARHYGSDNNTTSINYLPLDNQDTHFDRNDQNCSKCHKHDMAFKGLGHDDLVNNNINCTSTCHGGGTKDPITFIHNAYTAPEIGQNSCGICHVKSTGGGGLLHGISAGDCTNCHFTSGTALNHHGYTTNAGISGNAKQGKCIVCHKPNVGVENYNKRSDISMPPNLACNWCHIYWPETGNTLSDGKVQIYGLQFNPNTTEAQSRATANVLNSHLVSENTTTPISDFAACFACHGASAAEGLKVRPFHGFGEPYRGDDGNFTQEFPLATDILHSYGAPTYDPSHPYYLESPHDSRHPGFNALNWLSTYVSPQGFKSKVEGHASSSWYDFDPWTYHNYFDHHFREHDRNDAIYWDDCATTNYNTFDIPWDNYAPGNLNQAIEMDFGTPNGYDYSNEYPYMTPPPTPAIQQIPTVVPVVPLSLP